MSVPDGQRFVRSKDPSLIQGDGTLKTLEGIDMLRSEYGLSVLEVLINDPTSASAPRSLIAAKHKIANVAVDEINAAVIQPKLRKSHVIAIFSVLGDAGLAHFVVIYGASNHQIFYMDPLTGKLVRDNYLDFGAPANRFLLLWME